VTFADSVRALFGRQREQIAQLEARIAVLEARPLGVRYCGTWSVDRAYERDEAATSGGSLWVALRASSGEAPGSSDAWQLAVKRGRDGKDAR
jgi:hypothetical protein